jgi:pyruvate-formate lyase
MNKVRELLQQEAKSGGCSDVDPAVISGILAFPPGYIDKDRDIIIGLQTDRPLKRSIKPLGGWRMVKQALKSYEKEMDPRVQVCVCMYMYMCVCVCIYGWSNKHSSRIYTHVGALLQISKYTP